MNSIYRQLRESNYVAGQLVIRTVKHASAGCYTHIIYYCFVPGKLKELTIMTTKFPLPPAINYEYEEIE
jgi:hypothetical protein